MPFPPPTGPDGVSQQERIAAAAWCARLGVKWSAEALFNEDGSVSLGLISPRSTGGEFGILMPTWMVERTVAGYAVVDAAAQEVIGVFPELNWALWAVIEAELRAVANNA
ncbi:hypothetical protein [Paracraurococcus lichenis]|uniref:Uncharacterized protein n=1 Tax=Paracraurococcus lichenis TaxID=3064888 RepID=A0ABT9ECQ3_9PROT|nr:hypothetical protein [Paracraurococcus sp. LOR1-02]MDO9713753.1 hypothetical protein [Paracraurococcus sp. LOR1-02]